MFTALLLVKQDVASIAIFPDEVQAIVVEDTVNKSDYCYNITDRSWLKYQGSGILPAPQIWEFLNRNSYKFESNSLERLSHPDRMHLLGKTPNSLLRFFEYQHLPEHLQAISKPIGELAQHMDRQLPESAEKTVGLRKLLEAKDCFVRANL